ncbi:single-stranded DNA-binding protein [Lachnospiraceae bacterium NSJ-143]|nr:single-stranded DNA-binding protein [Lachnospiraceae bacterium NSJ-143]
MENNENNKIEIAGHIVSECAFSHKIYGEGFYNFDLAVKRLSGSEDIIPITVSERLFDSNDIVIGRNVKIDGQVRSYNSSQGTRSRLVISVFAREIFYESGENENLIELNGFICRKPVYRTTPMGREIADILIAVNRAYNKSDYIPCIVWGRNARYAGKLEVGDNIRISGRIQSRKYQKKTETGTEERTAYEISVSKIERISHQTEEID